MKTILMSIAIDCEREWHQSDKTLRLGQWMYNHLVKDGIPNPKVFYEEDHDKAWELFYSQYVIGYKDED